MSHHPLPYPAMNLVLTISLLFGRFPSLGQLANPDHHLQEFEQLCSRFASASMKQDVLRWMLFPFSLKGRAEQWYTSYTYTGKGSWDSLKKTFSIMFFQQNEKKTLGATWARFSLLVKSDPTMSTLNPLVLLEI